MAAAVIARARRSRALPSCPSTPAPHALQSARPSNAGFPIAATFATDAGARYGFAPPPELRPGSPHWSYIPFEASRAPRWTPCTERIAATRDDAEFFRFALDPGPGTGRFRASIRSLPHDPVSVSSRPGARNLAPTTALHTD